jgi:hypothetical protein
MKPRCYISDIFIPIHTKSWDLPKKLCTVEPIARIQTANVIMRSSWDRTPLTRLLILAAVLFPMLSFWTGIAGADQRPQAASFQVLRRDSAQAEALANQFAALSPRVNREEADMLARCAYATVGRLRRQYRMFGTSMFNNFLIHWGIKKRGYCYQWAGDLLVALDALKLTSLELHWAETHSRTSRENNALVVTAKGQPFQRGIILECWEHFGHLRWGPVLSQSDPYVENSAYARFVRARATTPNVFAANHPVAFQTRSEAKQKNSN